MENNLEIFKKIYDATEISQGADIRISETLSNLPSRKIVRKLNVVAATLIFICVSSVFFGTIFPAKANALFNSVFGRFTNNNLNNNYDKYANAINKTASKNGVELTIESVVSDSLGVTLGYSLKVDKDIKGADLNITKMLINGKQVTFEKGSNFYNEISNREYLGYVNLRMEIIPEKFKLEFMVSDVGDIKGDWNFKLDTSIKDINKNSLIINPNIEKVSKNGSIKVSKVISTPLNTYIDLIYKSSEPIGENDKIQNATLIILDQNNREVHVDGITNTVIDEFTYHTEFYLKEYKGKLNELTIIPYKQGTITKEPSRIEDNYEIFSVKTKTPLVISAADLGSITINSITETKDSVKVSCSTESINGDILVNSLGLGNDIKLGSKPAIDNFNPIYFNEKTMSNLKTLTNLNNFVLEFDKDPASQKDKYSLMFNKYVKGIKIYKDLKITIPLMDLK